MNYRLNTSPYNDAETHAAMAKRCDDLARSYAQAASENAALAKLHRDLAARAR